MTEYEIADLAASKATQLQGLVSLIQVQLASLTEGVQQFMTILFAYLAAAHFVGARMDRIQVWLFTVLYVFWQAWTITSTATRGVVLGELQQRFYQVAEVERQSLGSMPEILRTSVAALLIAALLASLFFMWRVRHTKPE
jgi:hypothetical protein